MTIYNGYTDTAAQTKRRRERLLEERDRQRAIRQHKTAFELELERYYSECTCEPWTTELCDSCKRANDRRLLDEIPY